MNLASEIVVVSGLPRSGTSLMMQMLDRGGMQIVTDQLRTADIDNPRGYYEFEKVKQIKRDDSWLSETRGKAFKMISQLLYDLPTSERYRILFMRREIDEVLESQEKMLARLGRPAAPREQIRKAYEQHLDRLFAWLARQSHLETLMVSYNDLIHSPHAEAERVNVFLGGVCDPAQMSAAVDPQLYRNKKSVSP